MPWKRAKALNEAGPPVKFIGLFDACFRIQREASAAAGRPIPLIVENVRGAQKWVGRSRWNFGSYHLWGDVPALMPMGALPKVSGQDWNRHRATGEVSPHWQAVAGGSWFFGNKGGQRAYNSKSAKRKACAARIAKIPQALARHIGRVMKP
jgi:hypothetical protein